MIAAARPDMHGMVFSVLSALLDYPDQALIDAMPQARSLLSAERALPAAARGGLERFFDYFADRDLYTLQENYVALFDRGRATSLHLFEHVHGESRDRGQAMVDLAQMYEQHGLYLDARELPDYLPVFLEYLSRLPFSQARELLAETQDILRTIEAELGRRGSCYGFLIGALLPLAGLGEAERRGFAMRGDDARTVPSAADYRALDEAYADEAVRFMGAPAPVEAPVHFHDRRVARGDRS